VPPPEPGPSGLPATVDPDSPGLAHLDKLAEAARDYARGAKSASTLRAYEADWRNFEAWCRSKDLPTVPPNPEVVGLYLTALASGDGVPAVNVRTIERRLSALCWLYSRSAHRPNPTTLDRTNPHIREVMQGIRRKHWRPPEEKEAISADDVIRMMATLGHDLRGLRDRAILLLGFAGAFRRSEMFALDCGPDQTDDGNGWIEILEEGLLIHVRTKSGWKAKEIGPGSTDRTCPIRSGWIWRGSPTGPSFESGPIG
jgi:integrase